jgi:predicted nucleic acid-binding protein
MKSYADTSFLASLYLAGDAHHGRAVAAIARSRPRLPVSPFGLLELRNVFARQQKAGVLDRGAAEKCRGFIKKDMRDGLLEPMPLRAYAWIERAIRLTDDVTSRTGTRTLDILHLSLAQMHGAAAFYSFDKNQRLAAATAGFIVLPALI